MRRAATGGLLLSIVFAGAGGLALVRFATVTDAPRGLTEDERDYLAAASNLERFEVVSFAPPGSSAPRADAYREPGYPALLALSWRLAAIPPPSTPVELEAFARSSRAVHSARRLHALFLLTTALAAGSLAWRATDRRAGTLAFALVAASPALGASGALFASENLATPLLAAGTLALALAVEGSALFAFAAGCAFGLLALVRGSGTLAITAGALVLAFAPAPGPGSGRLRRLVSFLTVAALPVLAWQLRNFERLGHFVIADRGGLALAVRAELDRDVERYGALAAALAWTPLEAATDAAEHRAPEARFDRPVWSGRGNYFSRTVTFWRAERVRGGDPLAVDENLRRGALTEFVAHPSAHLAATAAVSWRALFVERSPEWTAPVDLRFVLGLLLAAALALAAFCALRAARTGDARFLVLLSLLAPAGAIALFHVLATEFLPRYALPLLPVAWVSFSIAVVGRRFPSPGSAAGEAGRDRS